MAQIPAMARMPAQDRSLPERVHIISTPPLCAGCAVVGCLSFRPRLPSCRFAPPHDMPPLALSGLSERLW